jgi:hypothetical protein
MELSDYQELLDQTEAHDVEKLVDLARTLVADVAKLTSDSPLTLAELLATWDTRDVLTLLIPQKVLEDDCLRHGRLGMYAGDLPGWPPVLIPKISDSL